MSCVGRGPAARASEPPPGHRRSPEDTGAVRPGGAGSAAAGRRGGALQVDAGLRQRLGRAQELPWKSSAAVCARPRRPGARSYRRFRGALTSSASRRILERADDLIVAVLGFLVRLDRADSSIAVWISPRHRRQARRSPRRMQPRDLGPERLEALRGDQAPSASAEFLHGEWLRRTSVSVASAAVVDSSESSSPQAGDRADQADEAQRMSGIFKNSFFPVLGPACRAN